MKIAVIEINYCCNCPYYTYYEDCNGRTGYNVYGQSFWYGASCKLQNKLLWTSNDIEQFNKQFKEYKKLIKIYKDSQSTLFPETSKPKPPIDPSCTIIPSWCPLEDKKE